MRAPEVLSVPSSGDAGATFQEQSLACYWAALVNALAAAYGVKQPELATLTGQSRQRIGQRAEEVDVTDLQPSVLRRQIDEVEGWPGGRV